MSATPFADLNALAAHLRQELENVQEPKKFILLYAYNGTGNPCNKKAKSAADLGATP
jgi:hypothetical protein